MANMSKIIGAVIGISVSVIVIATVLAPTITQYTAEGQALNAYAGLLSAVVVMTIVGCLMLAVTLVSRGD